MTRDGEYRENQVPDQDHTMVMRGGGKGRALTDAHLRVAELLVQGRSIQAAATEVGMSRQHASRLVHHDPRFQALLQRLRAEGHQRRSDAFWVMFDRANGVVQEALDEGDVSAAISVIKLGSRGVTDVTVVTEGGDLALDAGQHLPLPGESRDDGGATETFECPECGLQARSKHGLARHRRAKHGVE